VTKTGALRLASKTVTNEPEKYDVYQDSKFHFGPVGGTWVAGPFSHLLQCSYGWSLQLLICFQMIFLRKYLKPAYLGSLGEEVGKCNSPSKTTLLSLTRPIIDCIFSIIEFQGHDIFK
jgi:hypothetical protein